ncbi:histone H2A.Z-specific chaperone CHZ1-like [Cynara cardunculus var. scolymus]|uniref:histone H2A.Z-specific chaperone CHZ1-like n=1 Tax=Cynara cardunculus var. scolymus TaxID=59895 RepID=UPI000D62DE21|nr:histone H2A.Z-specific chaperone CHZ1-like [Cynara cardunculus var. scolymus]
MAEFEQQLDIIAKILDDLTSRYAADKEGEKDLPQVFVVVPTTPADVDAEDKRVEESVIVAEVVDVITSREAEVVAEDEENVDLVRADAQDEDLPITSIVNADDEEDEDDDKEADDPLSSLDARKYLGADDDDDDDDNDDENDFTIQYHTKPAAAQKGVSLRESSSWGRKKKEK